MEGLRFQMHIYPPWLRLLDHSRWRLRIIALSETSGPSTDWWTKWILFTNSLLPNDTLPSSLSVIFQPTKTSHLLAIDCDTELLFFRPYSNYFFFLFSNHTIHCDTLHSGSYIHTLGQRHLHLYIYLILSSLCWFCLQSGSRQLPAAGDSGVNVKMFRRTMGHRWRRGIPTSRIRCMCLRQCPISSHMPNCFWQTLARGLKCSHGESCKRRLTLATISALWSPIRAFPMPFHWLA